MNKNLKPKIIELRDKGYSYKQIEKELNCSKGTIAFHCGKGVKEKSLTRQRKRREFKPLAKKIENFLRLTNKKNKQQAITVNNTMLRLRKRTWQFVRIKKGEYKKRMFNEEQLAEKIGDKPKCYLTGREICLDNSRSYQLDHIIPRSKGGDNSIANCGISCKEANQAKNDMSYDDFVQLCREVVAYHDLKNQK